MEDKELTKPLARLVYTSLKTARTDSVSLQSVGKRMKAFFEKIPEPTTEKMAQVRELCELEEARRKPYMMFLIPVIYLRLPVPSQGQVVGSELSRPAGYPDGPLLRTGLAELPHPAPDRSVSPHIFSENGTLTEFSIAMGIPAFSGSDPAFPMSLGVGHLYG